MGLLAVAVVLSLVPNAPLIGQEPPALRLGAGDGIRLAIADEPDLSDEYPVGSDGSALLPLMGSVQVAGRDFAEVELEVRTRLGRELAEGIEVQVVPVYRLAVLGEVRTPGLFQVDPTVGLADVLAMAGGFTPLADQDAIRLVREGRTVLETSQDSLISQRPVLRPGDRVIVGRKGWFRENLGVVIGAVGSLTVAVVTGLIVR
ncbi:MAG TPA: polysaccharide biosynthesis/export family protein [Longimicrobiales bacterium]|nr:polysaccharide biosynthesis/export family protein [Longimicrobiales bacterium]